MIVRGVKPADVASTICSHPLSIRNHAFLKFCELPGVDSAAIAEAISSWNVACITLVVSFDVPLHVRILVLAALDRTKTISDGGKNDGGKNDGVKKARDALDYLCKAHNAGPDKRKVADVGLEDDDEHCQHPAKRAKTIEETFQ